MHATYGTYSSIRRTRKSSEKKCTGKKGPIFIWELSRPPKNRKLGQKLAEPFDIWISGAHYVDNNTIGF